MNTLIEHATIVTLDEAGRVLHDASIAIAGAEIVAVGEIPPILSRMNAWTRGSA